MTKNILYNRLGAIFFLQFCFNFLLIADIQALDLGNLLRKYLDPPKSQNISVTTAPTITGLCTGSSTYTPLTDIVVTEGAVGDFAVQTNKLLVLDAPTGFEFNPGAGGAATGGEITINSVVITASQITLNLTVTGIVVLDDITITGIEVRATTGGASQTIKRNNGATTATIAGLGGGTVFGALSSTTTPNAAGTVTSSNGGGTVCKGQTGRLYSVPAITGATSYTWTLPTGATISAGAGTRNITVDYDNTAASGDISVYGSNGTCDGTVSANFAVTVNDLPNAAGTITGPSTVCKSTSGYVFNVPAITGATGYTWVLPTGFNITAGSNTNSITVTTTVSAVSGNITVQGTNTCGSGTISANFAVTVDDVPAAAGAVSGNTSFCPSETGVAYSVTAIAGATGYTWQLPIGATIASGANTNSITVDFGTTAGFIRVRGTNACGNGTYSANYPVSISSGPSAAGTITGPTSVCNNATGVAYSVTAVSGATGYNWNLPVGATISSGAGTNSITVDFGTTSGNISVAGTNVCGTGTASPNLLVTTQNIPNAAGAITGSTTPCATSTSNFYQISPIANATSYVWTVPIGSTITAGNGTNAILVTFGTTSGNVTVAGANGACQGPSASLAITLDAVPSNPGTITGGNICQSGTQNFSVPAISGATGYEWIYTGSGLTVTSGANTNAITMTASANATSGNLIVRGTNLCGNGNFSANFAVTVNVNPQTPTGLSTASSTVCQGQTGVVYSLSPIAGASSYTWSFPSGATQASGGTTNSITVNFASNASSGNIGVVANSATCTNSGTYNYPVTVNPLPVAAGSVTGSATVCQGATSVVYSVPTITNATSYVWSLPAGATIASGIGTRNITVNYASGASSGNITVYGTNSCGNGTGSTLVVTVNPTVSAAGSISGSATVCQGQSYAYSVGSISGATTYNWTLPTGATITGGAGTNSITVSFSNTATTGNITVQGSNVPCGNGIVSAPLLVTVNPLPGNAGAINGPNNVVPNTFQYSVNPIAGATNYIWSVTPSSTGSATVQTTANPSIVNIRFDVIDTYTITVKGNNTCGDGVLSTLVVSVGSGSVDPTTSLVGPYCVDNTTNISIIANTSTTPQPGKILLNPNEVVVFGGPGVSPAFNYYYYDYDPVGGPDIPPSNFTFNPSVAGVGTHTITAYVLGYFDYTTAPYFSNFRYYYYYASYTKTITVNPLPSIALSGTIGGQSFCTSNTGFTITGNEGANALGSHKVDIYNSVSTLLSSATVSNAPKIDYVFDPNSIYNSDPLNATINASTTFTLVYTYTSNITGCSNTVSHIFKVFKSPSSLTISGITNGQQFCKDAAAVTITGGQSNGAGSGKFEIYQGLTIGSPIATFSSPFTFDPTSTLYPVGNTFRIRYTYTNTLGSCADTTSYFIKVNPVPQINLSGLTNNQNFCTSNSSIVITGNEIISTSGAHTYRIYNQSSPLTPIQTTNSAGNQSSFNYVLDPSSIIFNGGNSFRLEYEYTDNSRPTNCKNIITRFFNVYTAPSALTISGVTNNQQFCKDATSVTITGGQTNGVGAGQFEIYQGYVINAGTKVAQFGSPFTFDPTAITYPAGNIFRIRYVYTNTLGGCQDTLSYFIRVNPVPALSFVGLNATYCNNDVNVPIQGKDGAANIPSGTYQIADALAGPYTADVTKLVDNGNGTATFIPTGFTGITVATDKWIRLTYTTVLGCSQTYTQKVTVNPYPIPTFSGLASTYCNDGSLSISLTGLNNGSTLNTTPAGLNGTGIFKLSTAIGGPYNINSALQNLGAGQAAFLPGSLAPGVYYVRLEVTYNSCSNFSTPQAVTINPIPTGISFSNAFDCPTSQVTFTLSGTNISQSLYFDYGDGSKDSSLVGDVNRKTTLVHKYSTTNSINYRVKFTVVNATGCSIVITKDITIGANPNADFTVFGSCQGSPTQFTDKSTISGGDAIKSWNWDFGDGNTSTSQSPSHTYTSPGAYVVKLQVSGGVCTTSKSQTIAILPNVTVTTAAQYSQNFDSNSGGWIAGGTNSSWAWGNPNKVLISNASSNGKVWTTGIGSTYNDNEVSVVQSPCFTFNGLTRPVMTFRYFSATQRNIDGASIFYTLDDGASWKLLGKPNTGQNWYNAIGVTASLDATSKAAWTGKNAGWKVAKYSLDEVVNDSQYTGKVRFRVGFGSSSSHSSSDTLDGFAFDEVTIGERNRITLIEYFNNAKNSSASSDASYINNFKTEDQAINIRYHITDPSPVGGDAFNSANTADPSARALLYGKSSSPATVLDGIYTQASSFSSWGSNVFDSRTLQQAPFNISIKFNSNVDGIVDVTSTVQALSQIDDRTLVQIVVIERSAALSGTTYTNVVRKMLPDAAGTKVDKNTWKQGTVRTFNQTWLPSTVADVSKLAVVVFVQSDSTKEVYQAAIADPASGIIKQPTLVTAVEDPSNQAAGFAEELILYPNPAQDVLNLQFDTQRFSQGHWSIYDNAGLMMNQGNLNEAKDGILKMNTSSYAAGVYFLHIKDKSGSLSIKKFVISR